MTALRAMTGSEVADALDRVAAAMRAELAVDDADRQCVIKALGGYGATDREQLLRGLAMIKAAVGDDDTSADHSGMDICATSDEWSLADIDLNDGSWLTPQQAAAEAKVSTGTILRWLRTKPIGIKVGGRWHVSREPLMRASDDSF